MEITKRIEPENCLSTPETLHNPYGIESPLGFKKNCKWKIIDLGMFDSNDILDLRNKSPCTSVCKIRPRPIFDFPVDTNSYIIHETDCIDLSTIRNE